jgi:hypothetical protein
MNCNFVATTQIEGRPSHPMEELEQDGRAFESLARFLSTVHDRNRRR